MINRFIPKNKDTNLAPFKIVRFKVKYFASYRRLLDDFYKIVALKYKEWFCAVTFKLNVEYVDVLENLLKYSSSRVIPF